MAGVVPASHAGRPRLQQRTRRNGMAWASGAGPGMAAEEAIARWTGGAHDDDYAESWPAFRTRVRGALDRLAGLDTRHIFAFTSGGPITAIIQYLTGAADARAFDMNWPLVNTGMTRLRFSAETGAISLATFNAHPHLEQAGDPGLVTFR